MKSSISNWYEHSKYAYQYQQYHTLNEFEWDSYL